MRKSRRKPTDLYYKPKEHAPRRVALAYGVFVIVLVAIALGIGHFTRRLGLDSTFEHTDDRRDSSQKVPSQMDASGIADRPAAPAQDIDSATPTSSDTEQSGKTQGTGFQPHYPEEGPRWFYTEIGLSPETTRGVAADSHDSKYTLVLQASTNLNDALKYKEALTRQGLHPFVQKVNSKSGKTSYRVQFGVFRSKRKAASEQQRLMTRYDINSEVSPLDL